MTITRDDRVGSSSETTLSSMVRDISELVAVLHAVYSLPVGGWLLTGTGIVPPAQYTAASDDEVFIRIAGVTSGPSRMERGEKPMPA